MGFWRWLFDIHPEIMNALTFIGLALTTYSVREIAIINKINHLYFASNIAVILFCVLAVGKLTVVFAEAFGTKDIPPHRVQRLLQSH